MNQTFQHIIHSF